MAIQNTNNLSQDTFVKYSIIRTAMLFNMQPEFDLITQNLILSGVVNGAQDNRRKGICIAINGGHMPQSVAANDMSLLKQVFNAYVNKNELSEHGYDGIPIYLDVQPGNNFEESYIETLDPELYVKSFLTVMQQRDKFAAQLATAYKGFMDRNFNTVISQIIDSNWEDKNQIASELQQYWANLKAQLNGQEKQATTEQPQRGE